MARSIPQWKEGGSRVQYVSAEHLRGRIVRLPSPSSSDISQSFSFLSGTAEWNPEPMPMCLARLACFLFFALGTLDLSYVGASTGVACERGIIVINIDMQHSNIFR